MPSQIIHLAIAKKYIEKHPHKIKDVQAFYDGNVLPDLDPNKEVSHCGVRMEKKNLVKRNAEKVNPTKFAVTHRLDDDLNRGKYLHLYVDYQYYNVFLLKYFKQVSKEQSSIDLYETSRRDDQYLQKKYNVEYGMTTVGEELQRINTAWDEEMSIIRQQPDYQYSFPYEIDELNDFIEQMSMIDFPQQ